MENNSQSEPENQIQPPEFNTEKTSATSVFSRTRIEKKVRRSKALRIISVILIVLLVLSASVYGLIDQNIHRLSDEDQLPDAFNLPQEELINSPPEVKGITNILLLGVDNRDADSDSVKERSDAIMILTIDSIHGRVKLTSLQRDVVVYFPGDKTPNKINSANAVGGPVLAMRVVNDTFRLNITRFMVVNMAGLEQIIDAVKGVKLDVSKKELKAVNEELAMVNQTFPDTAPSPTLESEGEQLLNGRQAVTYARIRKIDSDYARMERQRELLQALAKSTLKAGPAGQYKMLTTGLSHLTTNMSTLELTTLGLRMLPLLSQPIAQLQVPIEGYFNNVNTDAWKSLCDFNGMIPLVQDFIFGQTFPFDPVKKIKGAPHS